MSHHRTSNPSAIATATATAHKISQENVSAVVGNRYPATRPYSVIRKDIEEAERQKGSLTGKSSKPQTAAGFYKNSPIYPSMPKLDTLKIYAEKEGTSSQQELRPSLIHSGSQGLLQEVWSLFSAMEDQQRNQLLQGLLERCTVKQTDFICGAMNLKISKNALLGVS